MAIFNLNIKKKPKEVEETVVHKKVSKPTTKKAKQEETDDVNVVLNRIYSKRVDQMEKRYGITSQELHIPNKVSTDLLCIDTLIGGGIAAGIMYQVSGKEKGAKTTLGLKTFGQMIKKEVPVLLDWDAENAQSDPVYAKAAMGYDPKDVFYGSGKRARLYQESVLEDFYNSTKFIMRSLPDKIYRQEHNQWYFVFDADKEGRQQLGDFGFGNKSYDTQLLRDTGRLWVPTDLKGMQGFVLCDSYPALVTKQVDEEEEGKTLPALDARAFSSNIKKVVGIMKQKGFSILGINQIRTNPMPMYGCVHGETMVPFTDGTSYTMREVVENKIQGKVWSYNENTEKLEEKAITGWYNNGKVEQEEHWISFKTEAVDTDNGCIGFTLTPNHKVFTKRGWVEAQDLNLDDEMLSHYKEKVNSTLGEFLYGTLIGDSTIIIDSCNAGHIRICNNEQPEYAAWKVSKLSSAFTFKDWVTKDGKQYASNRNYEISRIKGRLENRNPLNVHHELSALSLAVHYMDDGTLNKDKYPVVSFKRFKNDEFIMGKICKIYEGFNLESVSYNNQGDIRILNNSRERIFKIIRKYIPDCMQYKLPREHQGYYDDFELKSNIEVHEKWVKVIDINIGSKRKFRMKDKYDITVEDNHNYMVGNPKNGVIIHNSLPEYEPGGNALGFYSSCRLQNRPRSCPNEWFPGIKPDGGKTTQFGQEPSVYGKGYDRYNYINVVNTKNKLARPGLTCVQRIWFSDGRGQPHGYDLAFDTFEYLKMTGRIDGSPKNGFKVVHDSIKGTKWTWAEFKLLILAQSDPILMKRAKETFTNMKTIPDIRKDLFKEIRTRKVYEMIVDRDEKPAIQDLED